MVKTLHFHRCELCIQHSGAEKKSQHRCFQAKTTSWPWFWNRDERSLVAASVTKRMMMLLTQTGKSRADFFFSVRRRESEFPSGQKDFEVTEQKAIP